MRRKGCGTTTGPVFRDLHCFLGTPFCNAVYTRMFSPTRLYFSSLLYFLINRRVRFSPLSRTSFYLYGRGVFVRSRCTKYLRNTTVCEERDLQERYVHTKLSISASVEI